jgi:hypothetical protein
MKWDVARGSKQANKQQSTALSYKLHSSCLVLLIHMLQPKLALPTIQSTLMRPDSRLFWPFRFIPRSPSTHTIGSHQTDLGLAIVIHSRASSFELHDGKGQPTELFYRPRSLRRATTGKKNLKEKVRGLFMAVNYRGVEDAALLICFSATTFCTETSFNNTGEASYTLNRLKDPSC